MQKRLSICYGPCSEDEGQKIDLCIIEETEQKVKICFRIDCQLRMSLDTRNSTDHALFCLNLARRRLKLGLWARTAMVGLPMVLTTMIIIKYGQRPGLGSY